MCEVVIAIESSRGQARAINLAPKKGWAIVAWGTPGEELKHKFLRDMQGRWHYDGPEKLEMVHQLRHRA